jgi:hypothetical protein
LRLENRERHLIFVYWKAIFILFFNDCENSINAWRLDPLCPSASPAQLAEP